MRELCLACAGFALEFIVFYAAGIVLVRILKVKGDCSLTFILGYLVYFAVFELVIVPMTLKWVSLTAAAYIWAGIMALVFWLTFGVIGKGLSDLLDMGITWLTAVVDQAMTAWNVNNVLHSLVIDGIFNGVGSVLSFLPIIGER